MKSEREYGAFIKAARDYCDVIESVGPRSNRAGLQILSSSLVALYGRALNLRLVELSDNSPEPEFTPVDWALLHRRISGELESYNTYQLVFEPFSPGPEEAISTLLSDDLADIYRNLKDGFLELESGGPEEDVFWKWRFEFESHWGHHAVNAITAIHSMLYGAYQVT